MKIRAGTVARTVVLAVALINQVFVAFGVNTIPLAEDTLTEFVSLAFTVGAALAAWWKNNSFTGAAVQADEVMKELKTQK